MSGNRIPLCKICKRTIYYGSDTCGKKDCNERFIKLHRIQILSPLSLGYHINNKKPFVTNKTIIFSPDLHRKDNVLSSGTIASSNDDLIENKISLKIIDTFDLNSKSIFLSRSNRLNKKQIINEWDELMIEVYAYKQDLIGIKNLYLKGVKLTNTIFEYSIQNMDKDLIKWLYLKKCPYDSNYIFKNLQYLSADFIKILEDLGYIKKVNNLNQFNQFNYSNYLENVNIINNNILQENKSNIVNTTNHVPIRIIQEKYKQNINPMIINQMNISQMNISQMSNLFNNQVFNNQLFSNQVFNNQVFNNQVFNNQQSNCYFYNINY